MAEETDERERIRRLREAARERWSGADDDADALASRLDSDDPEVRAEAVWGLAELASDPDRSVRLPVESRLAPLLDDDDQWVRRGASWALAIVADRRPERGRPAAEALARALTDDDPLVRENNVLALSAVAAEYPHAAEPALSRLADLVRDGDGLVRQYAAEALRRLVGQLDEDGFPETVEAGGEIADLLPDDAGVVAVTDEGGATGSIRVRTDAAADDESAVDSDARDSPDETGPPEAIPSPPPIDVDFRGFERLADRGGDPVTTARKARAPAAGADDRPVVVSLRTARSEAGVDADRVAEAFRAWDRIDDHDHVAPVLARGDRPRPWIATEFMDAGTLRDAVGSVGFERALWTVHCLSRAVSHAHSRGVVHGALRPGAVGLSTVLGAWPAPKVGDWGLGEPLAAVASPPIPPAFAAPEHFDPEAFGRPDQATDVYQLGALAYALFAGRPPFVDAAGEIVRDSPVAEPPPVTDRSPGVPAAVDDLVARALAADKRARFETAADFRRDVELLASEFDWAGR
ncbi:HEAT repeat domain-containing protein [Halorussus marinus]|uniref:HEAT repeat domain-containing protein n=1 Tax=Halorussus marinus TaxID=2505976 RepID=UPI00106E2E01|nr:HEAT repeat domain-containing protein [Halorussus marinus]